MQAVMKTVMEMQITMETMAMAMAMAMHTVMNTDMATETRAMEMGMPTATAKEMDKNPWQHRGDVRATATQQRPAGRQPLRSPPPRRKHMWIRLLPNRARIPSEPR